METFPKFTERGESEQENIEGLKESLISLCRKMKVEIESGKYDALVSDDTGGRIVTLLFRQICKLIRPDLHPRTLFVASGRIYRPKDDVGGVLLEEYLRNGLQESKSVLIITQYIHSGGTVAFLAEELRKIGIKNVDITSIYDNSFEGKACDWLQCDNLFVDILRDKRQSGFTENNNILSGISKSKTYNPQPIRLNKALENGDINRDSLLTNDEFDEIVGIEDYDSFVIKRKKIITGENKITELNSITLSDAEKIEIQKNINRTREHIKKLAEEIVKEVWGTKN